MRSAGREEAVADGLIKDIKEIAAHYALANMKVRNNYVYFTNMYLQGNVNFNVIMCHVLRFCFSGCEWRPGHNWITSVWFFFVVVVGFFSQGSGEDFYLFTLISAVCIRACLTLCDY